VGNTITALNSIDACSVARNVVTHFKHSSSAVDNLQTTQRELGMPVHMLLQDVATRWDSTHDMLVRFIELRRAVTLYANETDSFKVNLPSANQWQLLENTTAVLHQFQQLTKNVCQHNATLSYVIPAVATLKCFLETDSLSASGIKTMKNKLLTALQTRFEVTQSLQLNSHYVLATGIDPRFKLCFFTTAGTAELCKATLRRLLPRPLGSTPNVAEDDAEPPSKRAAMDCGVACWDSCFEKVAKASERASSSQ